MFAVDSIAQRENLRIAQAGILQFGEPETAAHQAGRDEIRQAELGVVVALRPAFRGGRLAHHRHLVLVDARRHGNDLARLEAVLGAQREHRIAAGVIEVAHRVRFDRDIAHLPALAESVQHRSRVLWRVAAEIGIEQPEAPLVGTTRTLETMRRERGGGDAAGRSPTRMEALGPRAFFEELHAARGHAEYEPLRVREHGSVRSLQVACGDGGAERADHTSGMKADLLPPAARVLTQPPIDFHRQQIRRERARTADAIAQALGEHHRHRAGRRVHDTRRMRVVIVQAVDQQTVEQRSVTRPVTPIGTDDDVFARTGERRNAREAAVCEIEGRGGEADAEGIENAELGRLDHIGRRRLEIECGSMRGQLLRQGKVAGAGGLQDCVHRTASNPGRAAAV